MTTAVTEFITQGQYLRGWSRKTVETYQLALRDLQKAIPGTAVHELSKQHLSGFVLSMRQRGLTSGGCNLRIRTVNSFLSWAHEQELTAQHLRIKLLPNPPKPLATFADADIRRLLTYRPKGPIELRSWTLVLLLLDTGLRINEALGLERKCVNLDALHLRVLGKGNRERLVPISIEGRRHLYRLMSARKPPLPMVFATHRGHRISYRNIYRDIQRVCAAVGIKGAHVHPHAFRHYFSVSYIRAGGDIYRLSRILGHSSINTTQLYLRSMGIEHLQEGHHSPLMRS